MSALYWLAAADDPENGPSGRRSQLPESHIGDDLPYMVELWNPAKAAVDLVLAVTSSSSIGFAAYHAATREFPDRYIVLRFEDSVLARWNGPGH